MFLCCWGRARMWRLWQQTLSWRGTRNRGGERLIAVMVQLRRVVEVARQQQSWQVTIDDKDEFAFDADTDALASAGSKLNGELKRQRCHSWRRNVGPRKRLTAFQSRKDISDESIHSRRYDNHGRGGRISNHSLSPAVSLSSAST